jgi:hypothetical protein
MDDDDKLIKDRDCAKRAGVTTRTLRRWEEDPNVGYPAARVIRNKRYRSFKAVRAWEDRHPGFGIPSARAASQGDVNG